MSLKPRALALLILAALLLSACFPGGERLGSNKFGWSPVAVSGASEPGATAIVYAASRLSGDLEDLGKRLGRDLGEDENKVKLQALQDNGAGASVLWTFPSLGTGEGVQGIFNPPVVSEELGLVFFSAADGILYALDREDGNVDIGWQQLAVPANVDDGDKIGLVSGPALGEIIDQTGQKIPVVVVGSEDHHLYAFNAATGEQIWEPFATGGKIWSTPLIQGNTVYFGSHDQHVYAVNLSTGEAKWKFATGGIVVASPLLFDNKVIVGSFDRKLYALNDQSGQKVWEFEAGNWIWAGAIASGSAIYTADMDGNVYALDKAGQLQWSHQMEEAIAATPSLAPKGLVVAGVDGKISVLDTGVVDAGSSRERSSLSIKDDKIKAPLFGFSATSQLADAVFLGTEQGKIRRVMVGDGLTEQWCFDARKNAPTTCR